MKSLIFRQLGEIFDKYRTGGRFFPARAKEKPGAMPGFSSSTSDSEENESYTEALSRSCCRLHRDSTLGRGDIQSFTGVLNTGGDFRTEGFVGLRLIETSLEFVQRHGRTSFLFFCVFSRGFFVSFEI